VVDAGLGNSAYVVDLGDGRALAVDASRDLRAVRAITRSRGLQIAFAADTHLHADFLSGAVQLAAEDGAEILGSAAGHRLFPHRGLADGDDVDLGGLTLQAWSTPGHTGEHLSYLLTDGTDLLGVFTGGSLIVGAAARTDLVSPDQTEALARAQYASLRRLAALPDATAIYPTHGAGSFCSAPPSAERTTTIGREKAANPLMAAPDEDAFAKMLLSSLGSFPAYFGLLAEKNRQGPAVLRGEPALTALDVARVQTLKNGGTQIIDVRPAIAYADAHIPGSLAIPLRDAFATWLGWLVPSLGTSLVFVRDPDQDPAEIAWQALKIGYDNLAGELAGGMPAWARAALPVAAIPRLNYTQVDSAHVVDVRQAGEYQGGHLPGALNIELGVLDEFAPAVTGRPVVTMCGHGERATTAASVLERSGQTGVAILLGGPDDWARATSRPLEAG
jgi:glyoxylase-like metal-dependent hydrolase (beta-lactamase superfamily II)/rhodanese-related sulfurtransferase